jgi:diaminohydroxyphosphoribosylaminopyrimidine deaminase/5-amino-6-(5-phosphoribosylamino)uracil reductase
VDLLLRHGITRVIYGAVDPNALVEGRGLAALAARGVKCQPWGHTWNDALAFLHSVFFSNFAQGTACVTLKAGLTLDGSIARKGDSRAFISGTDSRRFVQFLRMMHDSVMVGIGTLLADNPQLTVRDFAAARQPQPVLFDPGGDLLKIDSLSLKKLNLFSSDRPLWVVTYGPQEAWTEFCAQIGKPLSIDRVLSLPEGHLRNLPNLLWQNGISALLLEGGRSVYAAAVESQIFSQAFLIYSSMIYLGSDRLNLMPTLNADAIRLELAGGHMLPLGRDWCFAYASESSRLASSRTPSQEMSLM